MAKLYGEIAAKALLTLDKSFARANGQPLDASEVYYSKAAAEAYAATAQAYIGQKIVVIEDGVVTHYSVEDTAGTLKELGSKPVADGTTIAIGEDGKITLANITAVEESGTYNAVLVDGKLTWVKPSATTVEGLSDLIEALTGRVDGLEEAIGVASKAESAEGAGDGVVATGLHKKIEDETARAIAAEEALGERIDNISVPVTGVAEGDKVLSLTDTLLSATVALSYDEENKAIKLTGKDGVDLGSIDATPFIKDGMLEDVSYDADSNTLTFKWNTVSGVSEDTVVLSDIIEPYTAGNGLELADNSFAIKLADGTESFLTVSADGLKLSGVQSAIDAAKQSAIDDAATKYATIETVNGINGRVEVLEAIDHTLYATKEELETTNTNVSNNTTKLTTIEEKIEEITSVGGEPNTIEYVAVNGKKLTPSEDDKTVDITVPTKFTDLTDDSGFGDLITAAKTQADKGVNDAKAAADAAAQAQSEVDAVELEVAGIQTTVEGHTNSINDYGTRIGVLEQADVTHATEYNELKTIVTGHTTEIAKKANTTDLDAAIARIAVNEGSIKTINETTVPGLETEIGKKVNATDVYTKTEIGTIEEGKTIVQMIEEAKTTATYDDTEVRGLISDNAAAIENIYKAGEDGAAATGVLATEITRVESLVSAEQSRAEGVEADFEERIADMETFWAAADDPQGAIDKLAEIVAYIEADKTGALDMAADIQENKEAIADIYTPADGETPASGMLVDIEAKADANAAAIEEINDAANGVLAQAKQYTNDEIAAIFENNKATNEVFGVIKGDVKGVNIEAGEIKSISVDLLVNGENELILNGGTAV